MADISVSSLSAREFRVQLREGERETTHQVTVPELLGDGLKLDDDLEQVVGVLPLSPRARAGLFSPGAVAQVELHQAQRRCPLGSGPRTPSRGHSLTCRLPCHFRPNAVVAEGYSHQARTIRHPTWSDQFMPAWPSTWPTHRSATVSNGLTRGR
jgi:hypothetical protein